MLNIFKKKSKKLSLLDLLLDENEIVMSTAGLVRTKDRTTEDMEIVGYVNLEHEGLMLNIDGFSFSDSYDYGIRVIIYNSYSSVVTKHVYIFPKIEGNKFYCSFDSDGNPSEDNEVDIIIADE